MSLFFKPDPKQSEYSQATKFTKALSILCTVGLLNVMSLPAQAAVANERANAAVRQQNLAGEDAYAKLTNLTAKFELEQNNYQLQRKQLLAKRNIFKRTFDGVTQLFQREDTTVEVVDDSVLNQATEQIMSLSEQLAADQRTLIAQLSSQTLKMQQSAGFSKQDFLDHRDLILEMDKRYRTLQGLLDNLVIANSDNERLQAMQALSEQIDAWQPEARQVDMDNLPWGMPDNDVREPIMSESDAAVLQPATYHMDAPPYSAIHQWRDTEYRFGQMLLHKNDINFDFNSPFQKTTGLAGQTDAGNWTVLNALPVEVQPADLTETQDIQISQAIQDKARDLNHNPAEIYKWVHDNIEYVPTYGSIQGSDFTLQTLRGNSFDTASLLIALLRASDIPARYVYGTVDIPAKQAMDWVGGVSNIDAAQNLLGQGGVPNNAFMSGGVPQFLRMEHVWVEANVNAISRGVANNNAPDNSQNQWIPLDASYKSYTRTEGIDLESAVPFDAEALIEQATADAEINEATGSVKNLNQGAVNQAIENYQAEVQAYLEQNHADATVGDILGTDTIKPYNSSMLSPVLPYKVQTVISDYQELPASMRHYFVVDIYRDATEQRLSYQLGESPAMHVKIATVDLQGKPLAMSFKAANEDQILGMLPKPDANGDIDPNSIPSSFPRSVGMTASVTLGNDVLVEGNTYPFGTEVTTRIGIESPKTNVNVTMSSGLGLSTKVIRAGEYHAIGYDLQGMSQQQLERTKTTLETSKAKLEAYQGSQDATALTGLSRHDLAGSILQAGIQSYFAINDAQDRLAVKQAKEVVANRFMSYGTFHTFVKPNMRYGVSFGGSFKGMQMDVDRMLRAAVAKDNTLATLATFNKTQGPRQSANEHLVPEQLFDDPNTTEKEVEGVSAVKALQLAAQEGQTIYTITKENYNAVLPNLRLSGNVMQDISNAINSGKEVTVHEKNINFKGRWNGAGYIILDPTTGTGAYLIDGGANGAILMFVGIMILSATIVSIIELAIMGGGATALGASILGGGAGLALATVQAHIANLLMMSIGAIISGLALQGLIPKKFCNFGFAMIGGGVGAGLSAALGVLVSAGRLSEPLANLLGIFSSAAPRTAAGGGLSLFITSDIC